MYFATVACETVRPSFKSSPGILGAPPQRIRAAHLPYQIPQVPPNGGPTPSASALPCPVEPEAPAVLLPQREILQRQLAARANRGAECPEKDSKPSDHGAGH